MNSANADREVTVDDLAQARYDLAAELLGIIEHVPVKGDPSWVGWSAAVDMKGRILGAFHQACREKGLELYRR